MILCDTLGVISVMRTVTGSLSAELSDSVMGCLTERKIERSVALTHL